jgi:hypothetical protein
MRKTIIREKWRRWLRIIVEDWLDSFYVLNSLIKNACIALSISKAIFYLRMLTIPNSHQHYWSDSWINLIHEIAAILIFLILTIVDLIKYLRHKILNILQT